MNASALSAGQIVSETYEIERLLGRGGMGEVWLATHRRLRGKQVAIKVLHAAQGNLTDEALARFRREAEIAARLSHPNIVEVLDYNTLPSGSPYLVMELLRGENLAARLKRGPLSPEEIRHVIRHVGAALQAAHAAGVVHRDLKPENIFLVPTSVGDQVKVLDFGISKLTNSSTVQTTDSALIGTPLYMSPEQALGQNRDIGPQSDLFSLGSIAWELVTGEAPFAAPNIALVVHKIAFQPNPSLAQVKPEAPANFVTAIDHALQKDRSARTTDIESFVLEMTGEPLVAVVRPPVADAASGVMGPDASVSASMLDAATLRPGSGKNTPPIAVTPQGPVTPNSAVTPANTGSAPAPAAPQAPVAAVPAAPVTPAVPPAEPPSNPKGALYGGLGAAAVLLVLGLLKLAGGSASVTAEVKSDPPTKVVEAPVIDAGAPQAVVAVKPVDAPVAEAPDAAVAFVAVDSGWAGTTGKPGDLGAPDVMVGRKVLTAAQQASNDALLNPLREAARANEWDRLKTQSVDLQALVGHEAKVEATLLLLEARCRTHDVSTYRRYFDEAHRLHAGPRARALCKKYLTGQDCEP